jgi:lipopolysaccharide biosynthesis glycosyltransferase
MLKIFIGTDKRQPVAYNVLQYSIMANSSAPVAITPIVLETLPINRVGLTQFTYSRYMVPYLCNYEGWALFLDADMVVDADIAELFSLCDDHYGVMVVKKDKRFEWPSLMLFNCAKCTKLTPDYIQTKTPQHLEDWAEGGIGELPLEWNYCVGYDHQQIKPKLIHYTAGIPVWPETIDCAFRDIWKRYVNKMLYTVSFQELMGTSVHVGKVATGEINK